MPSSDERDVRGQFTAWTQAPYKRNRRQGLSSPEKLPLSSRTCSTFKIRDHKSLPFSRWPRPAPLHSFTALPRRSDSDVHDLRASADRIRRPLSAELPRLMMAFSFDNSGGAFTSPIPNAGASAQIGKELQEIRTEV